MRHQVCASKWSAVIPFLNHFWREKRQSIAAFAVGLILSSGVSHALPPPEFSHVGGVYTQSFDLVLSHPDPEAVIVFTVDGSDPDLDNIGGSTYLYKNSYPEAYGDPVGDPLFHSYRSWIYTNAIPIYDRSDEPDKLTQISSTYHIEPFYFPTSAVRKAFVVQAAAIKEGHEPSAVVGHTYFIFPDGNPYSLPLLSLQIQEDRWFGFEDGIYVAGSDYEAWRVVPPSYPLSLIWAPANYQRRGPEAERRGRLEYFAAGAETAAINQAVGTRIHGRGSRGLFAAKNMRIYARSEYGLSRMEYPFFEESISGAPLPHGDRFKRLLLRRQGGSCNFGADWFIHKIMQPHFRGMARTRPAIQFVNGEFWGLTTLYDRLDQFHVAHHYGIDPDNVIITDSFMNLPHEISHGTTNDLALLQELFDYVKGHDLSDHELYAPVLEMLDIDAYIDHLIANIYFGNSHHEYGFWRAREPVDDEFGDGRWRVFTTDFDDSMWTHSSALNSRIASVEMFSNLLTNAEFRYTFINRFADHLNTTFHPNRVEAVIESTYAAMEPYLAEDLHRWSKHPVVVAGTPRHLTSQAGKDSHIAYGQAHPSLQRQYLRQRFGISHDVIVELDVNDPAQGGIQINATTIDADTAGVPDPPYPWTGIYFAGIPIQLKALPREGYQFAGWFLDGSPTMYSTNRSIALTKTVDVAVLAQFEPLPEEEAAFLLHEWEFGDSGLAPSFTVGGAALSVWTDESESVSINEAAQGFSSSHLRVNVPLAADVVFLVPTLGYRDMLFSYTTRRSNQGAGLQAVSISTNGIDWVAVRTFPVFPADPQLRTLDLSGFPMANDQSNVYVRISFGLGAGGEAGNHRFDDVRVTGYRMQPAQTPPSVTGTPGVEEGVEGGGVTSLVWTDYIAYAGTNLLVAHAVSSHSAKVGAAVVGEEVVLTPLERGQSWIQVTVSDGHYYPVEFQFRMLVHPAAYEVTSGPFVFREWGADEPDGEYPANMLFVHGEQNDSGLTTSLLHAYSLSPEDYHANDQDTIGFPYNNTGRTRINGLDEEGVAFINTGQGRDLGGAIVAVDTRGLTNAWVRWLGGTVLPNSRIYAIRLQYRVGVDGEFVDVLDGDDQPVEYVRNSNAGHTQRFGPVALPAAALDQEYVQLLWRYYRVSGMSGPRAQLRLDEILVHDDQVTYNTGTPLWWLASHGLILPTYEAAALSVPDGGTLPAWKSYVADLDPTDPSTELPRLSLNRSDGEWAVELGPLSTNRWYAIQKTSQLVSPDWQPVSSGQGESAFDDVDSELPASGPLFLRVLISVP